MHNFLIYDMGFIFLETDCKFKAKLFQPRGMETPRSLACTSCCSCVEREPQMKLKSRKQRPRSKKWSKSGKACWWGSTSTPRNGQGWLRIPVILCNWSCFDLEKRLERASFIWLTTTSVCARRRVYRWLKSLSEYFARFSFFTQQMRQFFFAATPRCLDNSQAWGWSAMNIDIALSSRLPHTCHSYTHRI